MTWKITKAFDTDAQGSPVVKGTGEPQVQLELPTGRHFDVTCDLPYRFQLFDGDGWLIYEGQSSSADDDEAFEPLDWAETDSGCAYIEYRQADGTWEML